MTDVLTSQREYYAARAPEYDDWWFRRGRYVLPPDEKARWDADIAQVEAALEACAPRGDVLELAAGTGLWTRHLVRLADRVVALDANPEVLALNRAGAELHVVDIFEWEPDEEFDLCFFGFWVSHVPEERFDAFWSTVRSALKPGGRVFLVDNGIGDPRHPRSAPGERELRMVADGREFEIVKHYWRPDELAQRVAPLGFALDLHTTANGNFLYGSGS